MEFEEYKIAIRAILEEHKKLSTFGYGLFRDEEARKSPKKYEVELREKRDDFLTERSYDQLMRCCDFLGHLEKTKVPNNKIGSSYQLKHDVEHYWKIMTGENGYVKNGVFIAAAIHSGFPVKQITSDGPSWGEHPNALIGIRKSSLTGLKKWLANLEKSERQLNIQTSETSLRARSASPLQESSDHHSQEPSSSQLSSNGELNEIAEFPASDRLVPIDHNSNQFDEAVRSLDAVIEAFRDDHRKDNELGIEKSVLLRTLQAGRDLLSDSRVSIQTAITTLLCPLRIITKRYEKEFVAGLAATAFFALAKLFGFL